VESAVVRLEPLARILEIDEQLLRRAFFARRKTLRNALPESISRRWGSIRA